MKKMIAMLMALTLLLGLAACGTGRNRSSAPETEAPVPAGTDNEEQAGATDAPAESADDTAADSDAAPEDGTPDEDAAYLDVMLESPVTSLDPALAADDSTMEILANCVEGLMRLNADGEADPALAESYDLGGDGLTYTFHLRDAVWSDGSAVTANDFVFAWRRVLQSGGDRAGMLGADAARVKNADAVMRGEEDPESLGVSAPDDRTLVVELEAPVSFFPSLTALPVFYPVSEEFINGLEGETFGADARTFLSNGAFMPVDWTAGADSLTLRRNPEYRDADNVTLEGIRYHVYATGESALDAFREGQLDVVSLSGDLTASAAEDEALADLLQVTGAGDLWYLIFNQGENGPAGGKLANESLRRAVSGAVDRGAFGEDMPAGEAFSAGRALFADYESHDPDSARSALEQARSELGEDAFELTLIYSGDGGGEADRTARTVDEQVETTLEGVTIDPQTMSDSEILENLRAGSYDIALVRWSPDVADPAAFLTMWASGSAGNYAYWSSGEYDAILADAASGAYGNDADSLREALRSAETLLTEEAVILPLYTSPRAYLVSPDVSGIVFRASVPAGDYRNAVIA